MATIRTATKIAILAALLIAAAPARADNDKPPPMTPKEFAEVASLVRAVGDAKSAEDASKALVKLFKGADRKKLERLKQVKEDGVALRAAWEEVRLLGMKDDAPLDTKVDAVAAARFLGFVEGRLRLQFPVWWEAAIKHGTYGKEKLLQPEIKEYPYHRVRYGEKGQVVVPKNTLIKQDGDEIRIIIDRDSISLPAARLRGHLRGHVCASVNLMEKHWLLAAYNSLGEPFPLRCLDRRTGDMIWENTVWNTGRPIVGASLPPTYQLVDIQMQGEKVVVLGTGDFCFFIEAFDAKTGRPAFRFSSYGAE